LANIWGLGHDSLKKTVLQCFKKRYGLKAKLKRVETVKIVLLMTKPGENPNEFNIKTDAFTQLT
jgi:hypothetical protein